LRLITDWTATRWTFASKAFSFFSFWIAVDQAWACSLERLIVHALILMQRSRSLILRLDFVRVPLDQLFNMEELVKDSVDNQFILFLH